MSDLEKHLVQRKENATFGENRRPISVYIAFVLILLLITRSCFLTWLLTSGKVNFTHSVILPCQQLQQGQPRKPSARMEVQEATRLPQRSNSGSTTDTPAQPSFTTGKKASSNLAEPKIGDGDSSQLESMAFPRQIASGDSSENQEDESQLYQDADFKLNPKNYRGKPKEDKSTTDYNLRFLKDGSLLLSFKDGGVQIFDRISFPSENNLSEEVSEIPVEPEELNQQKDGRSVLEHQIALAVITVIGNVVITAISPPVAAIILTVTISLTIMALVGFWIYKKVKKMNEKPDLEKQTRD